MKKLVLTFSLALTCVLGIGLNANAQSLITWVDGGPAFAGGDNTDFISQNGTFVVGFNGGGPDVVIGDSTFQGFPQTAGGAQPPISVAGISGNGVTLLGNFANANGPATFGSGQFTGASGIDNTNGLIGGAAWEGTSFTISGLAAGDTYEMQILVNDARTNGNRVGYATAFSDGINNAIGDGVTPGTGDSIAVVADQNEGVTGGGTAGDYVIGTFTADVSGSQTFSFVGTRGGFTVGEELLNPNAGQSQFNAFQLRNVSTAVVPEPSSLALLGIAGLGMVTRRRRK